MFGELDAILLFIAAGIYHGKVDFISWSFFTLGVLYFGLLILNFI